MDDLRQVSEPQPGMFRCYRMVPQGKFHYFFSFGPDCFINDHSPKAEI